MATTATHPVVKRFCSVYRKLNKTNVEIINELYHEDTQFVDPFHHVNGLKNLRTYMEGMYENVISIKFEYGDIVEGDGHAYIPFVLVFLFGYLFVGGSALAQDLHLNLSEKAPPPTSPVEIQEG